MVGTSVQCTYLTFLLSLALFLSSFCDGWWKVLNLYINVIPGN
jgi:hypothetical protein